MTTITSRRTTQPTAAPTGRRVFGMTGRLEPLGIGRGSTGAAGSARGGGSGGGVLGCGGASSSSSIASGSGGVANHWCRQRPHRTSLPVGCNAFALIRNRALQLGQERIIKGARLDSERGESMLYNCAARARQGGR